MFVLAFNTQTTPTSVATEATAAGPIAVGDQVTDFTLPVVGNEGEVTLSDEYKQGPVVLVMLRGYPGYQCPLCSRQVGILAKAAGELGKVAHRVILVYPGEASMLDKHAEEFMGKSTLPSPLVMVRDPGMKMVTDWNLRWDAPRETAYPSTYVIDREGKVRWSKVSNSHGGRTTAEEILSELKKL
jgi:peroxiredoxin